MIISELPEKDDNGGIHYFIIIQCDVWLKLSIMVNVISITEGKVLLQYCVSMWALNFGGQLLGIMQ